MRLTWSSLALEDRKDIFNYIEADSPRAAIRVDERIRNQVERLVRFPASGRRGRVPETRELVVVRTRFIVAYRIIGTEVRILRVLHGARLWPEELPQQ